MRKNVKKAMTALTQEDRSAALEAVATEVEVIRASNPKASHQEIADRIGIDDLKEETVEAITRSDEMANIKKAMETRKARIVAKAVEETWNFMDLLVARATDIKDPESLNAMTVIIDLWDKKMQEKTVNIMIDNRSVSVPFVKAEWGVRNGQPYHIPTYQMSIESGDMADICRTNGCVHTRQAAQISEALFGYEEEKKDGPEA